VARIREAAASRGFPFSPLWLLPVLLAVAYRPLFRYSPAAASDLALPNPVERWLFAPSASSPLLLFALAVWLGVRRRDRLREAVRGGGAPGLALLCLLPAALLLGWGQVVADGRVLVESALLLLFGSGLLLGGVAGARALAMPGLFLAFALSLPGVALHQLVLPLQLSQAEIARALLRACGMAIERSGDLLRTPTSSFEIIETCSGVRAVETLFLGTLLYVEFFHTPRRRALLVLALAPAVALLTNLVRILSLVLNPYADWAAIHSLQGMLALFVGMLLIGLCDAALRRLPSLRNGAPAPATVGAAAAPAPGRAMALVALAAVFALASFLPRWQPAHGGAASVQSVTRQLGPWRGRTVKTDALFLGSVGFTHSLSREYQRGDERVELFLGTNDRLISQKTAYPGSGWELRALGRVELPGGGEAAVYEGRRDRTRLLIYRWYEGTAPIAEESLRAFFALDRGAWRRPGESRVYRVQTPLSGRPDERAVASERLAGFIERLREALPPAGPALPRVGLLSSPAIRS
jgi:exosortase